jgi:hypothetical protein
LLGREEVEGKAKYIEEKVDDVLMMAYNESNSESETVWYLDTGASNHMSGHKNLFVEIKVEVKDKGKINFIQKNLVMLQKSR